MEMQISNPVAYLFLWAFFVWGILGLIAIGLISLRRDKEFVYEDINKFLLKHSFHLRFLSVCMLYLILPLSIPYSITHIMRK